MFIVFGRGKLECIFELPAMLTMNIFHKRLLISSTILFLLGLLLGTKSDFEKLLILTYKETYIVLFGYLPMWGLVFILSIKNIAKNTKLFVGGTLIIYLVLHYFSLTPKTKEFHLLFATIGAVATMLTLKISNNLNVKLSNFVIVALMGGLTFLPWTIHSEIWTLTTSVFLWQLFVGHYLNYVEVKAQQVTAPTQKAGFRVPKTV
ncbi:MAG: hypothetical protein V4615_16475 [Bacteroidota bacterium]